MKFKQQISEIFAFDPFYYKLPEENIETLQIIFQQQTQCFVQFSFLLSEQKALQNFIELGHNITYILDPSMILNLNIQLQQKKDNREYEIEIYAKSNYENFSFMFIQCDFFQLCQINEDVYQKFQQEDFEKFFPLSIFEINTTSAKSKRIKENFYCLDQIDKSLTYEHKVSKSCKFLLGIKNNNDQVAQYSLRLKQSDYSGQLQVNEISFYKFQQDQTNCLNLQIDPKLQIQNKKLIIEVILNIGQIKFNFVQKPQTDEYSYQLRSTDENSYSFQQIYIDLSDDFQKLNYFMCINANEKSSFQIQVILQNKQEEKNQNTINQLDQWFTFYLEEKANNNNETQNDFLKKDIYLQLTDSILEQQLIKFNLKTAFSDMTICLFFDQIKNECDYFSNENFMQVEQKNFTKHTKIIFQIQLPLKHRIDQKYFFDILVTTNNQNSQILKLNQVYQISIQQNEQIFYALDLKDVTNDLTLSLDIPQGNVYCQIYSQQNPLSPISNLDFYQFSFVINNMNYFKQQNCQQNCRLLIKIYNGNQTEEYITFFASHSQNYIDTQNIDTFLYPSKNYYKFLYNIDQRKNSQLQIQSKYDVQYKVYFFDDLNLIQSLDTNQQDVVSQNIIQKSFILDFKVIKNKFMLLLPIFFKQQSSQKIQKFTKKNSLKLFFYYQKLEILKKYQIIVDQDHIQKFEIRTVPNEGISIYVEGNQGDVDLYVSQQKDIEPNEENTLQKINTKQKDELYIDFKNNNKLYLYIQSNELNFLDIILIPNRQKHNFWIENQKAFTKTILKNKTYNFLVKLKPTVQKILIYSIQGITKVQIYNFEIQKLDDIYDVLNNTENIIYKKDILPQKYPTQINQKILKQNENFLIHCQSYQEDSKISIFIYDDSQTIVVENIKPQQFSLVKNNSLIFEISELANDQIININKMKGRLQLQFSDNIEKFDENDQFEIDKVQKFNQKIQKQYVKITALNFSIFNIYMGNNLKFKQLDNYTNFPIYLKNEQVALEKFLQKEPLILEVQVPPNDEISLKIYSQINALQNSNQLQNIAPLDMDPITYNQKFYKSLYFKIIDTQYLYITLQTTENDIPVKIVYKNELSNEIYQNDFKFINKDIRIIKMNINQDCKLYISNNIQNAILTMNDNQTQLQSEQIETQQNTQITGNIHDSLSIKKNMSYQNYYILNVKTNDSLIIQFSDFGFNIQTFCVTEHNQNLLKNYIDYDQIKDIVIQETPDSFTVTFYQLQIKQQLIKDHDYFETVNVFYDVYLEQNHKDSTKIQTLNLKQFFDHIDLKSDKQNTDSYNFNLVKLDLQKNFQSNGKLKIDVYFSFLEGYLIYGFEDNQQNRFLYQYIEIDLENFTVTNVNKHDKSKSYLIFVVSIILTFISVIVVIAYITTREQRKIRNQNQNLNTHQKQYELKNTEQDSINEKIKQEESISIE